MLSGRCVAMVSSTERRVVLQPAGLSLSPQWLEPPELSAVVDLIETTGSDDTTPAPWWSDIGVQPDPPPDNVTYLDSRSTTWGTTNTAERALIMEAAMDPDRAVHHPTLQMLGPIELLGATGTEPARAARQCLEYCAWLLDNPGSTAQAMVAALAVAEGTRRSNMSRLRSCLAQALMERRTCRTRTPGASRCILRSVPTGSGCRSSPPPSQSRQRRQPAGCAGAGSWCSARRCRARPMALGGGTVNRHDFCVRDIGLELADRALLAGDLGAGSLGRGAGTAAAPGDELLLATRIRTEHTAGTRPKPSGSAARWRPRSYARRRP